MHFHGGINKIYNYLRTVSREQWELLNNLLKYKQDMYNVGEWRSSIFFSLNLLHACIAFNTPISR